MATVTLEYATCNCWKCGITFAVPAHWIKQRREDSRDFWCPNGHGNYFPKVKPLEDRQADILRLHMEEQAEARAADAKGPRPEPVIEPAPQPAAPVDNRPETLRDKSCPKCGKVYRSLACYQKHLRNVCKVKAA